MSHHYAVGQPYIPGKTRWPEQIEYNWRSDGHELRLFFPRLRKAEIHAITDGPMDIAVTPHMPVIFFCVRFGTVIPWSDAPYSWRMVPPDQRSLPPLPADDASSRLSIILIDADSGLIAGLRALRLTTSITNTLHDAIRTQAERPYTQEGYDARLSRIRARYTSAALAAQSPVVMTVAARAARN